MLLSEKNNRLTTFTEAFLKTIFIEFDLIHNCRSVRTVEAPKLHWTPQRYTADFAANIALHLIILIQ
jgi:hypothetical protein